MRVKTAVMDLRHVLPTRDAERGRHDREAVLVGVERRSFETYVEAYRATRATLGFPFHPLGVREPVLLVRRQASHTHTYLFADDGLKRLSRRLMDGLASGKHAIA